MVLYPNPNIPGPNKNMEENITHVVRYIVDSFWIAHCSLSIVDDIT